MTKKIAVIPCGGQGTRLAPDSQPGREKHLIRGLLPTSDDSLIEATLKRLAGCVDHTVLVMGASFEKNMHQVAGRLGISYEIVVEPEAKNTGPAVTAGVAVAQRANPEAVVGVFWCDHGWFTEEQFKETVDKMLTYAKGRPRIVQLLVEPEWPNGDLGWGLMGHSVDESSAIFQLEQFWEKPRERVDEVYTAGYKWNSGNFAVSARTYAKILQLSDLGYHQAFQIISQSDDLTSAIRRGYDLMAKAPIEHIVHQRAASSIVATCFPGTWSDFGSFEEWARRRQVDQNGNVVHGQVVLNDCRGSIIRNSSKMELLVSGAKELVVVLADNGNLIVIRKGQSKAVGEAYPLFVGKTDFDLVEVPPAEAQVGVFREDNTVKVIVG